MKRDTAKILRESDIEVNGSLQLSCPSAARVTSSQSPINHIGTKPQVRIVEKTNEFAVIQVTCSCGKITNIKCEYAQ